MNISLVIGTYNPNKEWFESALKSADGLFNETIIVDDGSDNDFEVHYDFPCTGITFDHNKGFYKARNAGCKLANGEWIASLDDDDEFIRENVEELIEFIKTTDADIVHFPIELFGNQSGMANETPDMEYILENNQLPSGSWFRKSVWQKLNGFQVPTAEDWDFWARAWRRGAKFAHFPKPIYRHRMRDDSLSAKWTGEEFYKIRQQVRDNYEN